MLAVFSLFCPAEVERQHTGVNVAFNFTLGGFKPFSGGPESRVEHVDQIGQDLMDGRLVDYEDAKIYVLTHTLTTYGVFERSAYRREDGESHIFRLVEHVKRLFESAHILGIEIPFSRGDLIEACEVTLKANKFAEGYLRPVAFLGSEAMGLGALNNTVHVAIPSWQWGAYLGEEGLKKGIRAKVSSYNRLHVNVNMVKGKFADSMSILS